LPTVQIDGVVWAQVIIGNTVYAGGQFTKARPAGAAVGTDETPRSNLLAYDLVTGELKTTFAPVVNGVVRTLAKSADGRALYIGGEFTKVNGVARSRFASVNATSGNLTKLAPLFNGQVRVITASSSRIYVGGSFTQVGSAKRAKAAAFSVATRRLLSWAPVANNYVGAMTLTPDGTSVILGGAFDKIGASTQKGMASVDAKTAALRKWKINTTVRDHGQASAITSLTADSTTVYGSGYSYGDGNYEGAFAASPTTGAIKWLQDCKGDTYDVAVTSRRVFSVGHAHNCTNIGGYGEVQPQAYRALSVGLTAAGTVGPNPNPKYNAFTGKPAPALVNWFPELTQGKFTGQSQAAWSVEATSRYVAMGGEFPSVNGKPQQGLVRFALPKYLLPAKPAQGPLAKGADSAPVIAAQPDGTATVSWTSNYDRDDQVLSYAVLRDEPGEDEVAVYTKTATSQFWNRPTLTFTDSDLEPGTSYSYVIEATDRDGNTARSTAVTFTTAPA
jgi:hypothetical protein